MKNLKFILILAIMPVMMSCNYSAEDVKEINETYKSIRTEVYKLQDRKSYLSDSISNLEKENRNLRNENGHFKSGTTPEYILVIGIRQSTATLSITEHIKNNVNKVTLEIPVSERFYRQASIGQELSGDFKLGSFIFNGDASWLKVKVENKYVK